MALLPVDGFERVTPAPTAPGEEPAPELAASGAVMQRAQSLHPSDATASSARGAVWSQRASASGPTLRLGTVQVALQAPELAALEDFADLPHDLFAKYDMRTLAEGLVQRFYLREEVNQPRSDIPYDFHKHAELHHYFGDLGALDSGFKNQHQMRSSAVARFEPETRAEKEQLFSRLRLEWHYDGRPDNPVHRLRPKFAVASFTADAPLPNVSNSPASAYGRFVAVLRDEVKLRATWTPEDAMFVGALDILKKLQHTFYRADYPIDQRISSYGCNDVQIWGDLDLRDVQYFLAPEIMLKGEARAQLEADIERLIASGLPVYRKTSRRLHGRDLVQRGDLLSKGDAQVMQALEASLRQDRRGRAS